MDLLTVEYLFQRREELAAKARQRKAAKRERLKKQRARREEELRNEIAAGRPKGEGPPPLLKEGALGGGRGGAGAANTKFAKIERAKRELDFDVEAAAGVSAGKRWIRLQLRRLGVMRTYTPEERDVKAKVAEDEGGFGTGLSRTSSTISSASSEAKFRSFKKQLADEQSKEFRVKITVVGSIFVFFWIIGAIVFHFTEGWSFFNAFWYCFITCTSCLRPLLVSYSTDPFHFNKCSHDHR